jgi:hypothetical protein
MGVKWRINLGSETGLESNRTANSEIVCESMSNWTFYVLKLKKAVVFISVSKIVEQISQYVTAKHELLHV